jgi:hypothetical protein
MTTARLSQTSRSALWAIAWGLYFAFMGACFWFVAFYETSTELKTKIACDRYVSTLINSDDPVEITRANAMVDHLRCAVRRRLP